MEDDLPSAFARGREPSELADQESATPLIKLTTETKHWAQDHSNSARSRHVVLLRRAHILVQNPRRRSSLAAPRDSARNPAGRERRLHPPIDRQPNPHHRRPVLHKRRLHLGLEAAA